MANKSLFASLAGKLLPAANALNREAAPAYQYGPKHRLAQLVATGCLNGTFYASAGEQLAETLALAREVEPRFVAQAAVHARERAGMKDMPALLLATLSVREPELFVRVFGRVVDNGKMLRNLVQILRSGVVGRKSLGSRPKRLVQRWLEQASDAALLRAAVGNDPSLADVVKMVHPKPATAERAAFYAWLIGRAHDAALLPPAVRAFEAYKADRAQPLPDVPFEMLTALDLDRAAWAALADRLGWHALRMNLNTLARHGAFEVEGVAALVAGRLADADTLAAVRSFPYQVMAARAAASDGVPATVLAALEQAMERAIANVPAIAGRVAVCPDVSGSMSSPVTGYRKGATSKVRCIDVAALVAAAVLRRNPGARVMPFAVDVVDIGLDAGDSVAVNAAKLAAIGGGGTNCSAPLARLNRERAAVDLVVMVSDNESWIDATRSGHTATLAEWQTLRSRHNGAKLVCIDLQPYGTTQAPERDDILNVGGFSDTVFEVVARFANGTLDPDHWVGEIERVEV